MPEGHIALIGVCVYIAGYAFPIVWNIPFIVLIVSSIVSSMLKRKTVDLTISKTTFNSSILFSVFFVTTILSILLSDDIDRSLRLSVSILPAILLYFLIVDHFNNLKYIRLLYFSFAIVALGIAIVSIYIAWQMEFNLPTRRKTLQAWVQWSPILISGNDLTFLSIIAPFSCSLVLLKTRSIFSIIAILSVILSVTTVFLYQSRGATLTIFIATIGTVFFVKPRYSILIGIVLFILLIIVDALMGFPLYDRFSDFHNNRIKHWNTAWLMFMSKPVIGHGPNTFGLFDRTPWAHNLYLEVLAEKGLVGFIAFICIIVFNLLTTWKIKLMQNKETTIYAASAFGATLGFCLASVVELSFVRQWVVIMYFVLFGIVTKLNSLTIERKQR